MTQGTGGLILPPRRREPNDALDADASGHGDSPASDHAAAPGHDVLVTTSSLSWVRRFEIRGAWPFVSAAEVQERFEQLVHRRWLVSSSGAPPERPRPEMPPADVFVVGKEIWVEVDLPGVDPDSVDVQLRNGDLVIEAERRARTPARGARAAAVERPRGRVHRRVPLPLRVGAARLERHFERGILQVRIQPAADSLAEGEAEES